MNPIHLSSSSNQTSQKEIEKEQEQEQEQEIELEIEDENENDQIESIPMLNSLHSNNRFKVHSKKPSSASKDLWGFYSYSFASEIFSIVAVSLFLPITLEQFARDNGFQYPNHNLTCQGSSKDQLNQTNILEPDQETVCDVKLLGRWFDTASFPLYVFSISVAIQAILVCSLGDAADHLSFAGIGSLTGMGLFLLKSESQYWSFISVLVIVSNVSLGGSLVCLNSFIPSISKTQPEVIKIKSRLEEEIGSIELNLKEEYEIVLSNTISKVSSNGISIGFTAGILCLFVSLIPVTIRNGDTTSLRWAVGCSAVWWAIFTIPAAIWLPPSDWKLNQSFHQIFNPKKSWQEFAKMLRSRKKLKHTFYYLMAWFLLSDAYSTITSTAIIFGKTALKMSSSHLILIGIITPATGILGALLIPNLQYKLVFFQGRNGGLRMFNREWELFVLAGVFGKRKTRWILYLFFLALELDFAILLRCFFFFWVWVLLLGVLYGAFQSYARSLFAELIPPGQEAKWYALFSITDKSSSFFGPFIVGAIADLTHNIRYGFVFILLILLVSLPLLNLIHMEIGKEEAFRFSEEEQQEEED
ncbi:uncharacterized protein MELLADRAFT_91511 [Melampsora larici-populina 98AG31]|uniref:Autophagy-related protein n=1 Tax=Melampsora larici-populina (strain 98AG31 / pathotype 3-4-7) TaxID=747676 RepID=F4RZB6_MELLP|nr:uncharacterized protein MELLADRAFT_91511 [Melampsora larici-populina 98AG31]EGG02195.1 hypothetical protein MELLADRAFT_91511 [Melampsora larici-populina 98AG31]